MSSNYCQETPILDNPRQSEYGVLVLITILTYIKIYSHFINNKSVLPFFKIWLRPQRVNVMQISNTRKVQSSSASNESSILP